MGSKRGSKGVEKGLKRDRKRLKRNSKVIYQLPFPAKLGEIAVIPE